MKKKQNSDRYVFWGICALLAIASFAVYSKVLRNEFIYLDDPEYVTENYQVKTGLNLESIKWAFTTNCAANWHPLTWLSHMADCELFGLKPWGHHLMNLLGHIANTLLLFAFLKMITGAMWRSAFVAAAFALHPLHVESVAWVAERKDVLSTLFWMLTMISYFQYARKTSKGWYAVTLVFFAMGLMSKPMLVTLPFVLLLMDYWPLERTKNIREGKISGRLVFEKLPLFALAAAASIVTFLVQRSGGAVTSVETLPLQTRLMNAVLSYARYIFKMFWPNDLAVVYPFEHNISIAETFGAAILLALITIIAVRMMAKQKYFLVGWLWYVGTLVPVIGLVQVGDQALADRYTYVPLIGLFIIAAWGAAELVQKRKYQKELIWTAGILVLAAMAIKTYIQVGYWKDNFTLFTHTLAVTKNNSIIHGSLGAAYADAGEYEKAIKECQESINIRPKNADAYCNLANAYENLGRCEEAIDFANKAIKIIGAEKYKRNNVLVKIYNNLGVAYGKLGRYKEAIDVLKESIRLMPNYDNSHYNLGYAYGKLEQDEEAMKEYREVLKISPNFCLAHNNIGVLYLKQGKNKEAIEAFKQAVRAKPDYAEARYNLGVVYFCNGDKASGMKQYETLRGTNVEWANRLLNFINRK